MLTSEKKKKEKEEEEELVPQTLCVHYMEQVYVLVPLFDRGAALTPSDVYSRT